MQTKWMSLVESVANVCAGFGLGVATQLAVFPLFGFTASVRDSLILGAVFTAVSIARSFTLRRLFNRLGTNRRA